MANYSHTIDLPMPSTDLSAREVIELIVESLQQNDTHDLGIEVTFHFASPENKSVTGPLNNFKELVKNPTFQPMLNFSDYKSSQLVTDGTKAQQIIIMKDYNGFEAGFLFTLTKQENEPFKDCWMTDSVRRVNPEYYGITV